MGFAEQMKTRRKELGLSRAALAVRLGVSVSAISNYENGLSSPKDDILLRLFDALEAEPNYLFRGSFAARQSVLSPVEMALVERYRALSTKGRQAVCAVLEAAEESRSAAPRQIPLFLSSAAVRYAAPIPVEEYQLINADSAPAAAQFALRIDGDAMEPHLPDGVVVYLTREPLENGDIGLFCVDNDAICRQYYRDGQGCVHLFTLNRARSDRDVIVPSASGITCFGKIMLDSRLPLPGGAAEGDAL